MINFIVRPIDSHPGDPRAGGGLREPRVINIAQTEPPNGFSLRLPTVRVRMPP